MRRPSGRASRASLNEYNDAVFRPFFERGEDIGRAEVLTALASALALDSEALGRALDTHEYLDRVVADEQEAAKLGIRGVPAFVANRRLSLSGVQTIEDLTSLVEHARLSA